MSEMFRESEFNGDISRWDVSNVAFMSRMFWASQFNGDISRWKVSNAIDMRYMFSESVLEKEGSLPSWCKV
jgi:hypothetical protein